MATVERSVSPVMEVVDFLLSRPTHKQIVNFRLSKEAQKLASKLLAKNREGTLAPEEQHDLDHLMHMETFLQLLTAKARLLLKNNRHE
jgi:hypothetical protein